MFVFAFLFVGLSIYLFIFFCNGGRVCFHRKRHSSLFRFCSTCLRVNFFKFDIKYFAFLLAKYGVLKFTGREKNQPNTSYALMCTIAEGSTTNLAQSGKHALSAIIRKNML